MSVLINGFVLSLINIVSIILGFIIYQISKSRTQISIQIISACFFSVILFLLWQFISQKLFKKITIEKKSDYWKTYFASILFSPVIFTPPALFIGRISYLVAEYSRNFYVSDSYKYFNSEDISNFCASSKHKKRIILCDFSKIFKRV